MAASFVAYIDESGDEGFVFNEDGSGSSRWFVLSAAIVRKELDSKTVQLFRTLRGILGKHDKAPLHFCKIKHEHRLPILRAIAQHDVRITTIALHKPSMKRERFAGEKHRLYRYATRFLLERVSWYCRDHRTAGKGDGSVDLIFSNRGQMSYDDIKAYLELLKERRAFFDVRVDWTVIDPVKVQAVNHSDLAGLQMADFIASGIKCAIEPNRWGDTEGKYLSILKPVFYRHSGKTLRYGLKFYPNDLPEMTAANPHLAEFADI